MNRYNYSSPYYLIRVPLCHLILDTVIITHVSSFTDTFNSDFCIRLITVYGFVIRGESPGCRLISTASMLEWLRNLLPHHSQGSSTEKWSRNILRVVTARVFYVLRGFLTSPFILNNSVETAAPFNVVSHPRCSEPRN